MDDINSFQIFSFLVFVHVAVLFWQVILVKYYDSWLAASLVISSQFFILMNVIIKSTLTQKQASKKK